MKVFLDTNVLVSALATRGLCADLFREILAEHELVMGEVVLEELARVLTQGFAVPEKTVAAILELLRGYPVFPRPETIPDLPVRDADDAWVLASALAAHAEVLVTGDKGLLDLGATAGILITDPRGFWNLLKTKSS
ncbi:MAG: putative toxin-antitoxin system toxin component, PIN family [Gammaproteobacteria bacterium]|nr:putative toxin-antitoxin system toxin component, PIN family [Gammaproteobacteria bacterium]